MNLSQVVQSVSIDSLEMLTCNLRQLVSSFVTLHYRLRGSMGFLNVQKVSKSRLLFLTEGTSKTDNFALFVKIMTQILC